MLNSFRASWRTMCHSSPPILAVWLIIAGLLLVGMWLVLGLHALLRARGVKKSATDHSERIYLYSKAVRLWHWSNALLFVLLLASGLINHFALVGATAVKVWLRCMKFADFVTGMLAWLCSDQCRWGNGHHYRIRRQGWLDRAAKQTRFYLFGIMQGKNILSRQQPSLNLIPYSRSPMLVSCMDCCHCYY